MEYRIATLPPRIQLSNSIYKIWSDITLLIRGYIFNALFNIGGQTSKDAINANLERTAQELRDFLLQYYSDDIADQMKSDFLNYIDHLKRLIQAYADGDEYAIAQNRNDLYFLANKYSQNYAVINQYFNRDAIQALYYALLNLVENQIISLQNQDFARDIEEYRQFVNIGFQLADEFTYGMLRQFYPGYKQ